MTAEERSRTILNRHGNTLRALIAEAVRLCGSPALQRSGERVLDIADAVGALIKPYTVCVQGCSHCCYMATAISGFEARMIGRYVGRTPRKLGREGFASIGLETELRERYTGERCTFLTADGKCSVYAVRPAACRLHHVMDDTNEHCRIVKGSPITTRMLNLAPIQAALAGAFMAEDFGDIREFFPPEEGTP